MSNCKHFPNADDHCLVCEEADRKAAEKPECPRCGLLNGHRYPCTEPHNVFKTQADVAAHYEPPKARPTTSPRRHHTMSEKIDGNISDLFFNTDLRGAELPTIEGVFAGYDAAKLRDEAEMFLNCLRRLNVAVPTVDALIADFYGRI